MSNYVLTLKLNTSNFHEDIINKRLEIARNIYNANVREILKRDRKMRHDPMYRSIKNIEKKTERNKIYRELNNKYEISKYALMRFTTKMNQHFAENIPADVGHNQAIRVFLAYEKVKFSDGKRMKFKKFGQVNSLEGKSNSGIAYKNGVVTFNTRKSKVKCSIPVKFYKNDQYQQKAMHDEIRYCRIVRQTIKGKYQYFVQLIMKGHIPNPYIESFKDNNRKVGIDIGTSTVAVVSEDEVMLKVLSQNIINKDRELRRLNRQLDRQRRANNPTKYNSDGTFIKNNEKWINSKRYLKTKAKRQEIYRQIKEQRRISHQTTANQILKMGSDIRVETMNFKGLQAKAKATTINEKTGKINKKKRFGKSLQLNAPALLVSEIDKKLGYIEQSINKLDTYSLKASQYNHVEDNFIKKKLNERWNIINNEKVQRDLYSAFLIMNSTSESLVDRDLCIERYPKFKLLHDEYLAHLKDTNIRHYCFN
jgi:hypothetical protein